MASHNIVIVGGSNAAFSSAHYTLKHIVPTLPKEDGVTYKVVMVSQSKDYYWRVAGPRICLADGQLPEDKIFVPIAEQFKGYGDAFEFEHATATGLNSVDRTLVVTKAGGATETIPYYALIIATGTHTPSPFLSLQTDSDATKAALADVRKALTTAKTIVIGGGGPVGVETAGEIGEYLNGTPGWFAPAKPASPKAAITLVTADKKLLPVLREALGKTAEKYLNRLGCEVVYTTRIESTTTSAEGKTSVVLSDGKTLEADLYIDATGARPNTAFLPKELLTAKGYVDCDKTTLRVPAAGEKVYVLGDVGAYTRGGILDIWEAHKVVMGNLQKDLTASKAADKQYKVNNAESQFVPIGKSKGVGAFGGWKLPSAMVSMAKGKDYLISLVPPITSGKQWEKAFK